MIVYHGSNVVVAEPKLIKQNRFLDFGFGFTQQPTRIRPLPLLKRFTVVASLAEKLSACMNWMKRVLFLNAACCILRVRMKRGWILSHKIALALTTEKLMISSSGQLLMMTFIQPLPYTPLAY